MEIFVIIVILVALGFDFTNGFHDAANAVAISISTKALTPKVALFLATIMNFIGSFIGVAVATTIAKSIILMNDITPLQQLTIVLSALLGAISWNIISWLFGLPTSSSHALIGGLIGAGFVAEFFYKPIDVHWIAIWNKVIMPMVLSFLIGGALAFIIMTIVFHIFKKTDKIRSIKKTFRFMQIGTSSMLALGHGLQDAQKSMGIVFMAASTVGWVSVDGGFPLWIKLTCALAISAGTYTGGFRIMKTLGRKIIKLNPINGFISEAVGSSVLWVAALGFGAPISTTHVITSSIIGSGVAENKKNIHWSIAKDIVIAWISTLPGAIVIGGIIYLVINGLMMFIIQ